MAGVRLCSSLALTYPPVPALSGGGHILEAPLAGVWAQEPLLRAEPGGARALPAPSSLISWLIAKQRKPGTGTVWGLSSGLGEQGYRGQGHREGQEPLAWGWQEGGAWPESCRRPPAPEGGWGNGWEGGSRPSQSTLYPHNEGPHLQSVFPQICSQPPHPQAFTCTGVSASFPRPLTAQMPSSSSAPSLPQQRRGLGHFPGLFMASVSPGSGWDNSLLVVGDTCLGRRTSPGRLIAPGCVSTVYTESRTLQLLLLPQ